MFVNLFFFLDELIENIEVKIKENSLIHCKIKLFLSPQLKVDVLQVPTLHHGVPVNLHVVQAGRRQTGRAVTVPTAHA